MVDMIIQFVLLLCKASSLCRYILSPPAIYAMRSLEIRRTYVVSSCWI